MARDKHQLLFGARGLTSRYTVLSSLNPDRLTAMATSNNSQAIRALQTLDQKLELGALALEMGCPQ